VRQSPVRTVFLGSGVFAVPILEAVLGLPEIELVLVVTAPDRPAGRRGHRATIPVAARAGELGLRLHRPERVRAPESIALIRASGAELGVLADYGQIIPPALLDAMGHGILNVHPSLLPRHRGASPVPATILAGDRETGVTIIRMDAGLDTGPIVAVRRWPVLGTETTPELEARAAGEGAALLRDTIPAWLAGSATAVAQPDDGVTLTRPLRREDGRLEPGRDAVLLERQVRAFQPWPGSFFETPAGRLIVWRAAVVPSAPGDVPGVLAAADGALWLATAGGRLLLLEVQPAGGRRMSVAEFLRGRPRLV